jgi:broad specificity phosphatase PhoE
MVRHGQSEWNAQGRWQGQADPPLTDLGRRQARQAARNLSEIEVVVASDLQRASETAAIMATHWGMQVGHHEARLRERHAGPWQGLTHAEIEQTWPGWIDSPRRPLGYEPDAEVASRALEALWDLAAVYSGHTVLAVSHSGTIRSVIDQMTGGGSRLANLAGVWLELSGGRLRVGEECHLLSRETFTRIE